MIRRFAYAFFVFVAAITYYNSEINARKEQGIDEYSVNLSILFFVSFWGFILYFSIMMFREANNSFDKRIIAALSLIPITAIVCNLMGINQTYEVYDNLTSNPKIDNLTIIGLGFILILILIRLAIKLKYFLKCRDQQ